VQYVGPDLSMFLQKLVQFIELLLKEKYKIYVSKDIYWLTDGLHSEFFFVCSDLSINSKLIHLLQWSVKFIILKDEIPTLKSAIQQSEFPSFFF